MPSPWESRQGLTWMGSVIFWRKPKGCMERDGCISLNYGINLHIRIIILRICVRACCSFYDYS